MCFSTIITMTMNQWSCLNFLNTTIVRNNKKIDLLCTPEEFKIWMTNEAQLNDAVTIQFSHLQSWVDSLNMLKEITDYRTELAEKLAAFMNGVISKEMLKERIETDLQQAAFILHFFKNKKIIVPTETHFEGFKSVILLHLYELIETNDIEKLCHCANPDCILVFINKTGKRKWCSMKICGNRHKVERFSKKSTSKKQGDDIHKT